MRVHGRFRNFDLRHDVARLRSIVSNAHLAVARLEPAISARHEAVLDLLFERGEAFAIISMVMVEGVMLMERESDPIMWPRWAHEALGDTTLYECGERLYPWLRSRVLARYENEEVVRFFRDETAIRVNFQHARDLRLLGAAPLAQVTPSLAEGVYAQRFARGRSVATFGPGAINAAAVLAGRAERVDLEAASGEMEFAQRWFSTLDIGRIDAAFAYDIAIGERAALPNAAVRIMPGAAYEGEFEIAVARSLPTAVVISFDEDDSMRESSIAVAALAGAVRRTSQVRAPVTIGGSSGRVVLLAREDWSRLPDADTDAILALAERLGAEGFGVAIHGGTSPVHPEQADIVHVIGHHHADVILPSIEALRRANVPVVVMPYLDDPRGESRWGAETMLVVARSSADDAALAQYLGALARRKLVSEVPVPPGEFVVNESVRRLLQLASAVIVVSEREEQVLRSRYGFAGSSAVAPAIFPVLDTQPVEGLTGFDDFVFMHAPIEPRTGILSVLLAAQREHLPLVLTGPVANAEYYTNVIAAMDDRAVYIPEHSLSDRQLAGLYARARVFADLSWTGRGLHRLARAGAFQTGLVGSEAGYARDIWGDLVECADPAGIDSTAGALRRAWDAAPVRGFAIGQRTAEACEQGPALVAIVRAYQQAAFPTVP